MLIAPGFASPGRADTCYVPDLAVIGAPPRRDERLMRDPLCIVEVLSASTFSHDYRIKVPDYRDLSSVLEILLIDSESVYAEILRRDGEHWISEIVGSRSAIVTLSSIGMSVELSELYDRIALAG